MPDPYTPLALLRQFPDTLRATVTGLPDSLLHANEGPATWSPYEVVAHLTDLEQTAWLPRLRLILATDNPVLPPVDREAFRRTTALRPLAALLNEFRAHRHANLATLRSIPLDAATLRRPARHVAAGPVQLSHLLATWAAHDLTHLHQLTRLLAGSLRDAVGPWHVYLSVLHCRKDGD
jgi:hypothetical protein